MAGQMLLLSHRHRLSVNDPDNHCGDSQSLLDGRLDGNFGRLCGIHVQRDISRTFACGGPSALGTEAREANTKHWRAVQTEGRSYIGC